jgi:hypothetical protein
LSHLCGDHFSTIFHYKLTPWYRFWCLHTPSFLKCFGQVDAHCQAKLKDSIVTFIATRTIFVTFVNRFGYHLIILVRCKIVFLDSQFLVAVISTL